MEQSAAALAGRLCQRLMQLSFAKIVATREQRNGVSLRRSLHILHVLRRAKEGHRRSIEEISNANAQTQNSSPNGQQQYVNVCGRQNPPNFVRSQSCIVTTSKLGNSAAPVGSKRKIQNDSSGTEAASLKDGGSTPARILNSKLRKLSPLATTTACTETDIPNIWRKKIVPDSFLNCEVVDCSSHNMRQVTSVLHPLNLSRSHSCPNGFPCSTAVNVYS